MLSEIAGKDKLKEQLSGNHPDFVVLFNSMQVAVYDFMANLKLLGELWQNTRDLTQTSKLAMPNIDLTIPIS